MAVTEKQLIANRFNALKSTGPKSKTGKSVVSKNAVSHGLTAVQNIILKYEDIKEYEELFDGLKEDFEPTTSMELILIEKIAQIYWKKQRLMHYEKLIIESQELGNILALNESKQYDKESNHIPWLEREIKELKRIIERLQHFKTQYEELHKIRNKKKAVEHRDGLDFDFNYNFRSVKNTLKSFLPDRMSFFNEAFPEALSTLAKSKPEYRHGYIPKDEDAEYYRILMDRISAVEVFKEELGYVEFSLENLIEFLKDRVSTQEEKLKKFNEEQEIKDQIRGLGLTSIMPTEDNMSKLQRYESYLDNQLYKALSELEKLQVFMHTKRNSNK